MKNRWIKILTLVCLLEFYLPADDQTRMVMDIQAALTAGDLGKASLLIAESLRQRPQDGGLLNLRGVLHARRQEMAEARQDFGEAVRLSPQLTPAWQNLARACGQLNETPCAMEAWQRVLRAKPGNSEAQRSLALLRCADLSRLGRLAEAKVAAARLAKQSDFSEEDFESMESLKAPAVAAILLEGLDARGAAGLHSLQRLVMTYEQLQRPADARKTLERVARLDPNNTAHLLELARLAESSKDYEGALGYLAHARDLTPDDARIHFLFGSIAGEMNLPIEAKQSLDKALAADPENPNYNYAMGSVILKTRDAAAAAGYFEKFVKARPTDAGGHYALGLAQFASGDYGKAKEEMRIAERSPAAAAAAEYYLGRIARLEGDTDEAVRKLRKSIELMPKFSETHTELARISLLQGNMAGARAELERALRLAPESFQANEQLLVLYKRTHDARAGKQAEVLKKLDEERSRRAELMLRTIEVRP